MWLHEPFTSLPCFVTEPVSRTPMYEGSDPGGEELLPPLEPNRAAAGSGGLVVGRPTIASAKPLKAFGAPPPLIVLSEAHFAPDHGDGGTWAGRGHRDVAEHERAADQGLAKTITVLPVSQRTGGHRCRRRTSR